MTDAEMYIKVHSWGHAPYFKLREFFEKEWMTRDDSVVKPFPAEVSLPDDIIARLNKWNCVLPEWW